MGLAFARDWELQLTCKILAFFSFFIASNSELFKSGIYYTHLSFDQLSLISADLNPLTSLPFAPLQTLQVSLWLSQELKSKILASSLASSSRPSTHSGPSAPTNAVAGTTPSTSSPDPSTANSQPELGITTKTDRILHEVTRAEEKAERALMRNTLTAARKRSRSRSSSQTGGNGALGPNFHSTSLPASPGSAAVESSPLSTPRFSLAGARFSTFMGGIGSARSPLGSPASVMGLGSMDASIPSERTYWPVATDDTSRWGEYGGFIPLSTDGANANPPSPVPAFGSSAESSSVTPNVLGTQQQQTQPVTPLVPSALAGGKKPGGTTSSGEKDFFGIGPTRRKGREIVDAIRKGRELGRDDDKLLQGVWTRFEPFRCVRAMIDILLLSMSMISRCS